MTRFTFNNVYVEVLWPDGSYAYFDLVGYCMLSAEALEGTTVKLVNSHRCSSGTNEMPL